MQSRVAASLISSRVALQKVSTLHNMQWTMCLAW